MGSKSADEIKTYSQAFWARGAGLIPDFDKLARRIEEGERKIAEKAKMADALSSKVKSVDNPWQTLSIKYGNNRGKLFTEEEDRFLVCMTHHVGYGAWEELQQEVRAAWAFRFDWWLRTRTAQELGRRVEVLAQLIQKEVHELEAAEKEAERQRKKAAAKAGGGGKRPAADETPNKGKKAKR